MKCVKMWQAQNYPASSLLLRFLFTLSGCSIIEGGRESAWCLEMGTKLAKELMQHRERNLSFSLMSGHVTYVKNCDKILRKNGNATVLNGVPSGQKSTNPN